MRVRALDGKVIVSDIERGERVVAGIIIPNDDGKSEGIRPRWGKVYSVGPDIKDIEPGQWILIENARWTRTMTIKDDDGSDLNLWGVEYPKSVLLVSDDDPETSIFSEFSSS